MSKFALAAATSHSLSVAAMEEASRQGLREADLEHLLLALVINGQHAGAVLRELGITIDAARDAVETQHRAQLAVLGIETEMPEPGRIMFHETRGYEWSKRANDLFVRSSGKGRDGSATAVLRELLDEPSGVIGEILTRLNTSPEAVLAALDEHGVKDGVKSAAQPAGVMSGSTEAFVPAPPADVWALLSDVNRVPEWEIGINRIVVREGADGQEGPWEAFAQETAPDGKAITIKPEYRRRRVELLDSDGNSRVSWGFSYPDSKRASSAVKSFTLAEVTGGTRVLITARWVVRPGWRRAFRVVMKPANRFLVWITLAQLESTISRLFR